MANAAGSTTAARAPEQGRMMPKQKSVLSERVSHARWASWSNSAELQIACFEHLHLRRYRLQTIGHPA
ncbi:hypothetical protein N9L68_03715 [bacterium]|nr:hypothetical protein [bacterium]